MLVSFALACSDPNLGSLPESRLPTVEMVQAVDYSGLRGFIHKPKPLPHKGIIYIASSPLFDHKECFISKVSNDKVSFLTSTEQVERAQQYISGISTAVHEM